MLFRSATLKDIQKISSKGAYIQKRLHLCCRGARRRRRPDRRHAAMAEDGTGVVALIAQELVWPRRCSRSSRQRLWTATVNADDRSDLTVFALV